MNDLNIPQNDGSPIGTVIAFAGNIVHGSLPKQWLLCDGSTLKMAQYPELYRAIGDLYGGSAATFNLPDFKGQFIKGASFGAATIENSTAVVGVGSTQENDLQRHQYGYSEPTIGSSTQGDSEVKVSRDKTRPSAIFVNYLIKVYCK